MQFKSDEQRRAVFARLKGKGGGGGQPPRPPRSPGTPPTTGIPGTGPGLDVILADIWNPSGLPVFTPLPPGPGIPGHGSGSSVGTGGAIYNNPASNWFVNPPAPNTNYGSYTGTPPPGNGPYQAPVFLQFQPAETFWGNMYDIVHGIDPETGDKLPPMGTPGTVKDPISLVLAEQAIDANWFGERNKGQNAAYYGSYGQISSVWSGDSHLSSAWHGQAPGATKKRPWWAK